MPFPVKLDLPPMRGAAFGLDATDVGWRRFTTDIDDLPIDPLDGKKKFALFVKYPMMMVTHILPRLFPYP